MQEALNTTDDLFFDRLGLDKNKTEATVNETLGGLDDGELFLEYTRSSALVLDDERIKSASFDLSHGFGLRGVAEDRTGFAHSDELSSDALKRASVAVRSVRGGYNGKWADKPARTDRQLYPADDPLEALAFEAQVDLLKDIDAYARGLDSRVQQVSASISAQWSAVQIIKPDGFRVADIRPLIRMQVQLMVEQDGRREVGSYGCGGRADIEGFLTRESCHFQVDEALRQALVNLESVPAPAGEMTVVLGPGWPGVLLHEAVGHGLEGDFNRKGTSAFAGLIGERVAAPGVTVVDEGNIDGRRGSLTIDDEGTPTGRTVLIEDGILKGFIQDRQNARLMDVMATGNGRRQSYAHMPMPRMTNTYMMAGTHAPEELIESVDKGIYAVNFGGGQVDITNGKFVFSCTEAYAIENGKIGPALKGATLIGNGPDALTRVSMIGNDLKLDDGIGTCGKNGQGVPVGVGQPSLRMDGLTVGGTAT